MFHRNFQQKIKEEEEYREAIDRYLRGNADMSLSSSMRCDANFLSRYPFPQVKCRMEQCKANYLYGHCLFTAQVFVLQQCMNICQVRVNNY
jgi:hypothetical protein